MKKQGGCFENFDIRQQFIGLYNFRLELIQKLVKLGYEVFFVYRKMKKTLKCNN